MRDTIQVHDGDVDYKIIFDEGDNLVEVSKRPSERNSTVGRFRVAEHILDEFLDIVAGEDLVFLRRTERVFRGLTNSKMDSPLVEPYGDEENYYEPSKVITIDDMVMHLTNKYAAEGLPVGVSLVCALFSAHQDWADDLIDSIVNSGAVIQMSNDSSVSTPELFASSAFFLGGNTMFPSKIFRRVGVSIQSQESAASNMWKLGQMGENYDYNDEVLDRVLDFMLRSDGDGKWRFIGDSGTFEVMYRLFYDYDMESINTGTAMASRSIADKREGPLTTEVLVHDIVLQSESLKAISSALTDLSVLMRGMDRYNYNIAQYNSYGGSNHQDGVTPLVYIPLMTLSVMAVEHGGQTLVEACADFSSFMETVFSDTHQLGSFSPMVALSSLMDMCATGLPASAIAPLYGALRKDGHTLYFDEIADPTAELEEDTDDSW